MTCLRSYATGTKYKPYDLKPHVLSTKQCYLMILIFCYRMLHLLVKMSHLVHYVLSLFSVTFISVAHTVMYSSKHLKG